MSSGEGEAELERLLHEALPRPAAPHRIIVARLAENAAHGREEEEQEEEQESLLRN
jgi:hypothetical protein